MNRERKNIEFEEVQEEKGSPFSFRSLIDGNVLTQKSVIRQAPFLAILVIISLLVIANRNHAEKLVIVTNKLQTEIKELRSQSITISSDLMTMSRQSRVEQLVQKKNMDLLRNNEPLKKLVIDQDK